MDTKSLLAWLACLFVWGGAICYIYRIVRKQIEPTISTWIIFLIGVSLSLLTYAAAENRDFQTGILNTADAVGVAAILIAVLIWGKREMRFRSFEKWYLGGIGAVVAYGMISGNAWSSNVFCQAVISAGYVPTIQGMVTEKKNKEAKEVWGAQMIACIVGLYPAFSNGNFLSALYAIRGIVLLSVIIGLMVYYDIRKHASKT